MKLLSFLIFICSLLSSKAFATNCAGLSLEEVRELFVQFEKLNTKDYQWKAINNFESLNDLLIEVDLSIIHEKEHSPTSERLAELIKIKKQIKSYQYINENLCEDYYRISCEQKEQENLEENVHLKIDAIKNAIEILEKQKTLIEIEKLDFETSTRTNASMCMRKEDIVSMIVIHHTGTEDTTTPFMINQWHLENGSDQDPWYMIGYNYVISELFEGATPQKPKVFQGRPPEFKGAHAGGYTKPLTAKERKQIEEKKIYCGNPNSKLENTDIKTQFNEDGGISGNLVSYGIAVIGNYSHTEYMWNGIAYIPKNINTTTPDRAPVPTEQIIDSVARLSCQLQRNNPNVKTLVPHFYFKKTSCPGNLANFIRQIKNKALEYGCKFSVKLNKDD